MAIEGAHDEFPRLEFCTAGVDGSEDTHAFLALIGIDDDQLDAIDDGFEYKRRIDGFLSVLWQNEIVDLSV